MISIKQLRIPELMMQKYSASHKDALASMKEKLDAETKISTALKAYHGSTQGSGSGSGAGEARTAASPDFTNGGPHNFRRRVPNVSAISWSDFETGNTLPVRICLLGR